MNTIPRKILSKVTERLPDKSFIIITGARQTGKTTLLMQLKEILQGRDETVWFLTLEDPAVLSRLNQHPENLFEFVIKQQEKRSWVLLDEIQYLANPTNFLKLLYDLHHNGLKIIATGSSAFYIDTHFSDSLAGRKTLFELYTLDFDEFLLFRTGDDKPGKELSLMRSNQTYRSAMRSTLEQLFFEYLTWGGYPAVIMEPSAERKEALLRELSGSFLKRDIHESNIRDHDKFYHLMLILAQQTGSLVNMNELSRLLNLSNTAVENYLYVLRKCYHIGLVRPFYRNVRKELTRMPKAYFHDLGFRNIMLNQFTHIMQRTDKGIILENYAYIRLRSIYGTDQIRFWRTADGHEVDFVAGSQPDSGIAIEVKTDLQRFRMAKYSKFIETYPEYPLQCRALNAPSNDNEIMAF
jgi:uncharacterized protein